MVKAAAKSHHNGLVIYFGLQGDGCTYLLDAKSRERIQTAFPEAKLVPRVFIGFNKEAEFERLHGPIWEQVATILTGLTDEQIQLLGGLQLYDPVSKSVVWRWEPVAAR